MPKDTAPVLDAPRGARDNPLTRSVAGMIGMSFLAFMLLACIGSLPYSLGRAAPSPAVSDVEVSASPRYDAQDRDARHLPPSWWPADEQASERLEAVARRRALERIAKERGVTLDELELEGVEPTEEQIRAARPFYLMGTDILGRSLLVRCLAGGGISLGIGLAAAMISVFVGTVYGAIAGYLGGRTDAVMMRIVDILYGLPYILLVVLLAVAVDARLDRWQADRTERATEQRQRFVEQRLEALPETDRDSPEVIADLEQRAMDRFGSGELDPATVQLIGVVTLLVAIGGVSWLTMARVVRGQVLSLKAQPFIEAARAAGVPLSRQFVRHLLPNLLGPIIVYATLTVPQAILQESFLSFLGIGVRPPLPSWGNLAADGLVELNPYKSHWWLLAFPCVLLGTTLLALNFVGEGLREAFDPKRAKR